MRLHDLSAPVLPRPSLVSRLAMRGQLYGIRAEDALVVDWQHPYALPPLRMPLAQGRAAAPWPLTRCHWCGEWTPRYVLAWTYERWHQDGTTRGVTVVLGRPQCTDCSTWLIWMKGTQNGTRNHGRRDRAGTAGTRDLSRE